jgi:hypothetical protein
MIEELKQKYFTLELEFESKGTNSVVEISWLKR